jgi:hypothetical protein
MVVLPIRPGIIGVLPGFRPDHVVSAPQDGVYLAGNLPKLIVRAYSEVRVQLADDTRSYLDETYTPDFEHLVTLDLAEIVRDALAFELPSAPVFRQPNLVRSFAITLNNSKVPLSFIAVRAGLRNLSTTAAEWLLTNFMTGQPKTKYVSTAQPEWLTYYASRACYLFGKAWFDGQAELIQLAALTAGDAWTVDVSANRLLETTGHYPDSMEVFVAFANGVNRLTGIQTYCFTAPLENEQCFCFENSMGGIDTVRCKGESRTEPEFTFDTALFADAERTYHVDKKDLCTQNTGWMGKAAGRWLLDMFGSQRCYHYRNGALAPIVIDSVAATTSTKENLCAFEFSYRPATASPYLDAPRNSRWLLDSGRWNDFGLWLDDANWNDG